MSSEFKEIKKILTLLEQNKISKAVESLLEFERQLSGYMNTVDVILAKQKNAVNSLTLTYNQTKDYISEAAPNRLHGAKCEEHEWKARFSEMCHNLATVDFNDVDNGLVYVDSNVVLFKGDTLLNYMLPHYPVSSKRFHLSNVRSFVGAHTLSAERSGVRHRVWSVDVTVLEEIDKSITEY